MDFLEKKFLWKNNDGNTYRIIKRKETSKSQSKKPNRNQPNLSQSEKRRSIGQQTRPNIAQNSSLLLQDEDNEEEDFKKEER